MFILLIKEKQGKSLTAKIMAGPGGHQHRRLHSKQQQQ